MQESQKKQLHALLLEGKSNKDISVETGLNYSLVANTRTKLMKAGVLERLRTRTKKNVKADVTPRIKKNVPSSDLTTPTPTKETPVLAHNFTRLLVNDTEVNITKAKEVIINADGIKIVY